MTRQVAEFVLKTIRKGPYSDGWKGKVVISWSQDGSENRLAMMPLDEPQDLN